MGPARPGQQGHPGCLQRCLNTDTSSDVNTAIESNRAATYSVVTKLDLPSYYKLAHADKCLRQQQRQQRCQYCYRSKSLDCRREEEGRLCCFYTHESHLKELQKTWRKREKKSPIEENNNRIFSEWGGGGGRRRRQGHFLLEE